MSIYSNLECLDILKKIWIQSRRGEVEEYAMELKQLQYFLACAQELSFSDAAQKLFTTQPNVSKVIKSLEEELGYPLFERHPKGISLTEAGKNLYEYALNIQENLEQIQQIKGE